MLIALKTKMGEHPRLQNLTNEDLASESIKQLIKRVTSNTTKECEFILNLRRRIADIILRDVLGTHVIYNPFFDVDFGINRDGIHRAAVTDIMHSLEAGLFLMLLNTLLDPMTDTNKKSIDNYVQSMFVDFGRNKSCERENYP